MATPLRQRMTQDLQLAGLSERTQEAYTRAVRQLAEHFRTPPDRLTEPQLREYFLHLKNDRHFAAASLGIAYAGIKFFYSHTCPHDWPTLKRLRVPGEARLPDVLSVDEVRRLIAAVRTPHNRTYFQAVYSLGLRLEEGLHLQVGDIDSARMMVHVHHGKGPRTATSRCRRAPSGRSATTGGRTATRPGCSPPRGAITGRPPSPIARWSAPASRGPCAGSWPS